MLPICCDSEHGESSQTTLAGWESFVEQFHFFLHALILSFHFFCLSISPCHISYSHFTDIDTDTLTPLSLLLLIFWLSLFSGPSLPISFCHCLHPWSLFLASGWLWITLERRKQGNECLFPFLISPAPVLTLLMIKVIIRALSSPTSLDWIIEKIWGGGQASENWNRLLIMPHFCCLLRLRLAVMSTFKGG